MSTKFYAFWFFGINASGMIDDAVLGGKYPDIRMIPLPENGTFDAGGMGAKVISQGAVYVGDLMPTPPDNVHVVRSSLRAWQATMLEPDRLNAFVLKCGIRLPWMTGHLPHDVPAESVEPTPVAADVFVPEKPVLTTATPGDSVPLRASEDKASKASAPSK